MHAVVENVKHFRIGVTDTVSRELTETDYNSGLTIVYPEDNLISMSSLLLNLSLLLLPT